MSPVKTRVCDPALVQRFFNRNQTITGILDVRHGYLHGFLPQRHSTVPVYCKAQCFFFRLTAGKIKNVRYITACNQAVRHPSSIACGRVQVGRLEVPPLVP